ncbi:hypothetical protein KUL72_14145 [Bradyrhizobium arachidis]|uniref:hypothetical protein n=1 Tax=Bradyrhizobium arachidis TaxID=858423 RepID=UPI0021637041|nr:hypothetical protein [Bradyrhizobium arachidis]UVO39406.1 hypothetical protein KUL72_14145 [Bradyrhizobium arachidis]
MADNQSDPGKIYPRLHVEMRRLSDRVILVDGRLVQNARGMGHTVLRNTCGMEEARELIAQCAAKYGARCDEDDIVIH